MAAAPSSVNLFLLKSSLSKVVFALMALANNIAIPQVMLPPDMSSSWEVLSSLMQLHNSFILLSEIEILNLAHNIVTKVRFINVKHSIQNLLHKFPIHTSWNEIDTDINGRPTLKSLHDLYIK